MKGARNAAPTIATVSRAASTTSLERRKLCNRSLSRKAASRLRPAGRPPCPCGAGGAFRSWGRGASSFIASHAPTVDANTRVDPHVDQIDDEIYEHEQEGHQHEI